MKIVSAKPTPGPWYATGSDPDFGLSVRRLSDHEVIAKIEVAYSGSAANARLIAEAPAMLELIRGAVDHLSRDDDRTAGFLDDARALLARIEGGGK